LGGEVGELDIESADPGLEELAVAGEVLECELLAAKCRISGPGSPVTARLSGLYSPFRKELVG
jgi:hypothetical protein